MADQDSLHSENVTQFLRHVKSSSHGVDLKEAILDIVSGAIIGDGDRKRGVHAKPSKKTNVLFLAKIAPPSTSQTRAGTRKFAWGSVTRSKLGSKLDYMLSTKALIKLSL